VVRKFLSILGLDIKSFAVGGSIVIFILGLEMVLGLEFFKSEKDAKASTMVPIAFSLDRRIGNPYNYHVAQSELY
jgi:multiple antibiotic resistance protein